MNEYWTDDSLPTLATPQRVMCRWGLAALLLLLVGFLLGWGAAGWQNVEDAPVAACRQPSLPPGVPALKAMAVAITPPGEAPVPPMPLENVSDTVVEAPAGESPTAKPVSIGERHRMQ